MRSCVFIVAVFLWMGALAPIRLWSQNSENTEALATSVPEMARRDVGGGFWRLDGNFDAILRIKNVLEVSDLVVMPVLWMADGTEYELAPLTIEKAGTATISIRYALKGAPPQVASHISDFGSAGIRYTWRWRDAAIAQITNIDEVNSLTYTTHLGATVGPNPELS